jgi:hypothetical protein
MAGTEFPKWKYHEEYEEKVVQSAEEEKALGPEWVDSPAEFGKVTAPDGKELKAKVKAKK